MLRRNGSWTRLGLGGLACGAALLVAAAAWGSPFATQVVSYVEGNYPQAGYTDPTAALGAPSSTTPGWPSGMVDVTVFNGPWGTDQLVSMGPGGGIVVKFDHAVADRTDANRWGIDFLVFGNSYLVDVNYPSGQADPDGSIYADPIGVAVSQNGTTWFEAGVTCTRRFPTMGFTNTSDPYGSDGSVLSDFTSPVDPNMDLGGKTFSQIQAAYKGAGGGMGVDFHDTGLAWVQYVKVFVDANADVDDSEVDAIVEVAPEPATLSALALGGALALCWRRRAGRGPRGRTAGTPDPARVAG